MKVLSKIIIAIAIIGLLCGIGYLIYGAVNYYFVEEPNPVVTMDIENYGTIKIELYPEYAPNTVANFIKLVENGYYNGKVFYGKDTLCLYAGRNAEGEVDVPTASMVNPEIEAGSPEDIKYEIKGEFVSNGFDQNTLSHDKYVVSLIRQNYAQILASLAEASNNSGNVQIGIMTTDARDLNGLYAGFGRVIEGTEVIDKINEAATKAELDENGQPVEDSGSTIKEFEAKPVITTATVDTFGKDYGVPEIKEYFDYQSFLSNYLSQYYSAQN